MLLQILIRRSRFVLGNSGNYKIVVIFQVNEWFNDLKFSRHGCVLACKEKVITRRK